jgi:hypothetical protein
MSAEQVTSPDVAPENGDFSEKDFATEGDDPKQEGGYYPDSYQPPPGFKLIPENYIGVEPTMYAMMLRALGKETRPVSPQEIRVQMPETPKEEPDQVFHIRLLQQLAIGDIGYNFQRGEEFTYCPAKRYIEVGGDRYTTLRSFLNMWNAHFGARPDPNVRKKPFFLILNSESCPSIQESLGRRQPTPRFRSDAERLQYEQRAGDAAHRRVHLHGETGEYGLNLTATNPVDPRDVDRDPNETMHPHRRPGAQFQEQFDPYYASEQPQQQNAQEYRQEVFRRAHGLIQQPLDPQQELQQMMQSRVPVMPARGGVVGPDGLTPRARMIRAMSGDQIQRPVQRQQVAPPVGGYEPPETVEGFPVQQGEMGGGRVVSQIPGGPADEALAQAQMMDAEAARLMGSRTQY